MGKNLNNSKLIAYSAAAGAALAIAPNAFAEIIHHTVDIPFGIGQGGNKDLKMEGDNAEFNLIGHKSTSMTYSNKNYAFIISQNTAGAAVRTTYFIGASSAAKSFAITEYVGPDDNTPNNSLGRFATATIYSTGYAASRGFWSQNEQIKYCGVSFKKNDGSGDKVYGWIKVERLSRASGKVISWAYENTGIKIQAGAMPEPATGLALLALGVAGIARYRRK